MKQDDDTVNNVHPLFENRPTAAPLPPQHDIIAVLNLMLADAEAGHLTGLCLVGYYSGGEFQSGILGKVTYLAVLGGLEDLKHAALTGRKQR